jgi:hypothetical protein
MKYPDYKYKPRARKTTTLDGSSDNSSPPSMNSSSPIAESTPATVYSPATPKVQEVVDANDRPVLDVDEFSDDDAPGDPEELFQTPVQYLNSTDLVNAAETAVTNFDIGELNTGVDAGLIESLMESFDPNISFTADTGGFGCIPDNTAAVADTETDLRLNSFIDCEAGLASEGFDFDTSGSDEVAADQTSADTSLTSLNHSSHETRTSS